MNFDGHQFFENSVDGPQRPLSCVMPVLSSNCARGKQHSLLYCMCFVLTLVGHFYMFSKMLV